MIVGGHRSIVPRNRVIYRAFRLIGETPQGLDPNATQTTEAIYALNGLVNRWQMTPHIRLWTLYQDSRTLTIGQATETLTNDDQYSGIYRAFITRSSINYELEVITKAEYDGLTLGTDARPTKIAFEDPTLYLYEASDETDTLTTYLKKTDNDIVNEDLGTVPTIYYPLAWFDALCFGLAAELGDEYGLGFNERTRYDAKGQKYFQDALSHDMTVLGLDDDSEFENQDVVQVEEY